MYCFIAYGYIAEFPTRAMLPYETMIIVLTVSNSEYIVENVRRKKLLLWQVY